MNGPLHERELTAFIERTVEAGYAPLVERPFAELAARWRALGLCPGDLVLLALPTGVALLQHFFGVLAAGGVPALLAPGAPSARLVEMACRMRARVVAAVRLPPIAGAERVETVGAVEAAWFAVGGHARLPVAPAVSEGEVVMLTSGTSGCASGCVTTLAAMARNALRHADSIGQREGDRVLVSLPLHFSFALVAQALATLQRGGALIVAGPPFSPGAYATLLAEHGVTVSALTPLQARMVLQQQTALPSSLRVLGVGGDSLAAPHVAELLRRRPGRELYLTYGLTQAGPRVSTLAAHAEPASRHASVGRPLAGTTVSLADVGDGSGRKELVVASDTLMRRRIGLVEGRAGRELRGSGEGRTLATGDVFTQDDAGYLYHRGRLAEYILRGGEKVALATVRRLATQLPGVLTATIRLAHRQEGEDFDLALVVADTPERRSPDQYRTLLARYVRRGELPRAIDVTVDDRVHPACSYK